MRLVTVGSTLSFNHHTLKSLFLDRIGACFSRCKLHAVREVYSFETAAAKCRRSGAAALLMAASRVADNTVSDINLWPIRSHTLASTCAALLVASPVA
jgi:hypothetical protein